MLGTRLILSVLALLLVTAGLCVAGPEPLGSTAEEFNAKLHFDRRQIALKGGLASLNLSSDFRYLDPDQSRRVLVDAWGNPPEAGEGVLGMIFPADRGPLDENNWAAVITYEEGGYVSDEGAEKINYDNLLREMQAGVQEANKERQQKGYESIALLGWAEPPHYDSATHKLYWAKEFRFGEAAGHTLNYHIRVLGRRGVLVLNAVASIDQLSQIKSAMPRVLPMVEFMEGHRYTDYIPGKDKLAGYGIAALIGGGVVAAAKVGVFKWLIAGLIAFKKVIILGALGAGGFLRNLFRRKSTTKSGPTSPSSTS